jgi:hypothetical protein
MPFAKIWLLPQPNYIIGRPPRVQVSLLGSEEKDCVERAILKLKSGTSL